MPKSRRGWETSPAASRGQGVEIQGPGGAVDPGDPVDQEAGAERAEDQVFHPGLEGTELAPQVGDQHVEGDGDQFEGDEGGDEVVGRGHPHHAGAGEHRQGVEFAGEFIGAGRVAEAGEQRAVVDGEQQHADGAEQREHLEQAGQRGELVAIRAAVAGRPDQQHQDEGEAARAEQPERRLVVARPEGLDHEEDQAEDHDEDFEQVGGHGGS